MRALVEKNRSLLPAGVVRVEGSFKPGDAIAIAAPDGRIVARGLSNYAATDIEKIKGKKTADIRALMGGQTYEEIVHRDNLAVEHQG